MGHHDDWSAERVVGVVKIDADLMDSRLARVFKFEGFEILSRLIFILVFAFTVAF